MAITIRSWFTSFRPRFQKKWGEVCPWPPKNPSPSFDRYFFGLVVLTVLFGLVMVYSSSFIFADERTGDGYFFIKKQMFFAILGFIALWVGSRLDYRFWKRSAYPVLLVTTVLLAAVFIPLLGIKIGGAQRWIHLGFFSFQPAEIVKFSLVVFAAAQLAKKRDRLHSYTASVLSVFLFASPALFLLLLQPDFGTVAIVVSVLLALMFIVGVPFRYLGATALSLVFAGAALIMVSPYRLARMTSFLNPWEDPAGSGFQILQSFIGIHNGSFFGVGLGNGKQKLFYLPEAHNDFIFSVVGEEVGLFGMILVVVLFVLFVLRGFTIAQRNFLQTGDHFALYLGVSLTLIIGLQAFVNMAVVLGLLPTKGLNLPFMSSGGSALLVNLFAVGILLNISKQRGIGISPLGRT